MDCPTKSIVVKKQLCEWYYPYGCGKKCKKLFKNWYRENEEIRFLHDQAERGIQEMVEEDKEKYKSGRKKRIRKTKIGWTEATANVITGCTQISEGCKNCYAKAMHRRLRGMGLDKYQSPFIKVVCHDIKEVFKKSINSSKINMCFINSMSDTFHKDVPDEYIKQLLEEIETYKGNVYFQLLTKRAERIKDFSYPENVWLGVTVEHEKYKERIEYLKQTDAKIKFLSCEPLLGDLGELNLEGIDWVIVGGESGIKARPMHPDWVRNIQRQCRKQKVKFFFKQWGEWKLNDNPCLEHPYEYRRERQPEALLDGKQYKQFPMELYKEEEYKYKGDCDEKESNSM